MTIATLEFIHDPVTVLAAMARVVRPGGRLVIAVLHPRSPWGLLDRPGRREPYRSGCFLPARDVVPLAARHGCVRRSGALFAAPQLPLPHQFAVAVERAGQRLLARFGGLQVVTVEVAR